jgi:hypothetical protein
MLCTPLLHHLQLQPNHANSKSLILNCSAPLIHIKKDDSLIIKHPESPTHLLAILIDLKENPKFILKSIQVRCDSCDFFVQCSGAMWKRILEEIEGLNCAWNVSMPPAYELKQVFRK